MSQTTQLSRHTHRLVHSSEFRHHEHGAQLSRQLLGRAGGIAEPRLRRNLPRCKSRGVSRDRGEVLDRGGVPRPPARSRAYMWIITEVS